jgi:hypothetical protein
MMTSLKPLQEHKGDLKPTSQWQYKASLTPEKTKLSEGEETQEDEWKSSDDMEEGYYSSQESQDTNHVAGKGKESDKEHQQEEGIYITRSGRTSKPPDRLTYDAQACLLNPDHHESQESWIEQYFLAYKASTDPETMYCHQAMKEPGKK